MSAERARPRPPIDVIADLRAGGLAHPVVRAALVLAAWMVALTLVLLPTLFLGIPLVEASGLSADAGLGPALVATLLQLVATTAVVWLFRRYLDRLDFASLGLGRPVAAPLAAGAAIGGGLMALTVAGLAGAGAAGLAGLGWQRAAPDELFLWGLGGLALMAAVGFYEELLTRGYLLQNLAAGLGLPAGLLASSLLFALLHLLNPGATALSTLNVGLAGLFFGLLYLRSGSLWAPIGAHAAWNFFQGYVFGLPVSGTGLLAALPLLDFDPRGDPTLSGGAFGPEGSLVTTALLLLASAALVASLRSEPKTAR